MNQDDLTICAFRYCLGRKTYVVGQMCNHLRDNWGKLCGSYQTLIMKEIHDAIQKERCGMEQDCDAWRCLLNDLHEMQTGKSGATYE